MCDMLWADPVPDSQATDKNFTKNDRRGCGCKFGYQPLKNTLKKMKLKMLIRAHEVQEEGFKLYKWNYPNEVLPLMATIFSASNYCGVYQNRGAVLSLGASTFNILGYHDTDLEQKFHLMRDDFEVDVFAEGFEHIGAAVLEVFEAVLNKAVTIG